MHCCHSEIFQTYISRPSSNQQFAPIAPIIPMLFVGALSRKIKICYHFSFTMLCHTFSKKISLFKKYNFSAFPTFMKVIAIPQEHVTTPDSNTSKYMKNISFDSAYPDVTNSPHKRNLTHCPHSNLLILFQI